MRPLFAPFAVFLAATTLWTGGSGCRPVLTAGPFSNGHIDASQFFAAGDGYVAGFANGGLYRTAQEGCFSALLAQQFALSATVVFRQPLADASGSGYQQLSTWRLLSGCPYAPPTATLQSADPESGWPGVAASQGAVIHNIGLPGLMPEGVNELDATKANPFWQRIEPNPFGRTYAAHAAQNPVTACVVWLGLESLMDTAASGRVASTSIATPAQMALRLRPLLDSLCREGGVSGIIGNLPSPGLLPLCASVGNTWFTDDCQALPLFITTRSGVVRAATGADRVLLPAGPLISTATGFGLSSLMPLPDSLVLDRDEMAHLDSLKDCYNAAWQLVADSLNAQGNTLVIADFAQAFWQLAQGIQTDNGVTISSLHLMGGIFSHDGRTLTQRGNAWVANLLLATINEHFGATLPLFELARFEGTPWP